MVFTKEQIIEFIEELIMDPMKKAVKWSRITNQSPHLKVGYSGQYLASLVTGVLGEGTGARGNDLADGSEVKSCSRVNQLDKCKSCGDPVLRTESTCSNCNSSDIERKNDSKWLITIRSINDLNTILNVPRVILILDEYPKFEENNFNDIRIRIWEINPKKERHKQFSQILTNYYHKIYLGHKEQNNAKTPAPKNFWPYLYQFYICNPILIFEAMINNAYIEDSELKITRWIESEINRDQIESFEMPPEILKKEEFVIILQSASQEEVSQNLKNGISYTQFQESINANKDLKDISKLFKNIGENLRKYLPLRDTDRISIVKEAYKRRTH